MNTNNFDELLYYLRQAASFIDTFPKMAVTECIPRNSLIQAADEIERLRQKELMWKMTAVKLAGKMLPFSLLMNESEREEIQIVLQEAIADD